MDMFVFHARPALDIASLLLIAAATVPLNAANCDALARLKLKDTTITTAETVAAGSFKPPEGPAIQDMPEFCRVAGVIKPSSDSDIRFEVWMPGSSWNNKFQGVGNGGFAGAIGFGQMAGAVKHGYATASTDTGHHAGGVDASWALGHPEKIADFGYRAIHETADKAKAIIRAYYGEAPRHSYFSSCSNGGRQALMEAQRYPADYDGIIAGAPAYYWTHLLTAAIWDMQATLGKPESYIPARKLPAIEQAVIAACDALDGVKDGVIDDPPRCHFNPTRLLCKDEDADGCLTAPQVKALQKIYDGVQTSKGEPVFPGFSPGGETGMGGWSIWVTGPAPEKSLQYGFGTNFFKNMVFDDPSWDFRTSDIQHDMKVADDKMASRLNATNADLGNFKKRGGKLILYHGWSDAAIPPVSTVDYYQSVVSKMGAKDTGSFVRLFMVPGMQHCGGGPGPSDFGQAGVAMDDPMHNVDAALEAWVEKGSAPEQVIAKKYKGAGPSSGVARTRPLCAYPKVVQWNGKGSTDDAANFICTAEVKAIP